MSDQCAFCLIAERRADAVVVHEDPQVVAFMDARPIRPGHVLVIPRAHSADLLDVDIDLYRHLLATVRILGRAIRQAIRPKRVGVVVAGFDVPHAHVHLIPMLDYHDVTSRALLEGTLVTATQEELRVAATEITRALKAGPTTA